MHKKKQSILQEINGRYAELNTGGSPSKAERVSSYKQAAVKIAYLLEKLKKSSPSELRKMGAGPKTQTILSSNIYGWFERIERGLYKLNKAGKQGYKNYKELIAIFKKEETV